MSKIIGIPLGTPLNPAKIKEKLNPITSINGIKADENGNAEIKTDATLKFEKGMLSVNTTNDMERDNTLPITSAGVFATVGNIEALLKTI
jgi:hypothetical protein